MLVIDVGATKDDGDGDCGVGVGVGVADDDDGLLNVGG